MAAEKRVPKLRSRPVQGTALLLSAAVMALAAPAFYPLHMKVGHGLGAALVPLALAALFLGWRRSTRGYIPVLTLALAIPVAALASSGEEEEQVGRAENVTVSGEWVGSNEVRQYRFRLEEAANGDITGTVLLIANDGEREQLAVGGSRFGSDVLLRLRQTDHTPWVFTGRLIGSGTMSGHWSVGDMVLDQMQLRREG